MLTEYERGAALGPADFSVRCATCGVNFMMPRKLADVRMADHATFYCPLGHWNVWREGKTREQQLEEEALRLRSALGRERKWATELRSNLECERKRHASTKGQLTKTKNRIAKGVCPCCNRSFTDLTRHMATKHPDYSGDELK